MSAPERPRRNPKVALPNPEAGLYPAERAPDDRGEAAVWRAFGKHRPQGWTVWHHIVTGLGLNQAEIDFVIAIPGKGIVLLEVKAASSRGESRSGTKTDTCSNRSRASSSSARARP